MPEPIKSLDSPRAVMTPAGGPKSLGIIGGIAPVTTIDYYRWLIAGWRERVPNGSYPGILINSIDLSRVVTLVTTGRLDELADWLVREVGRLAAGGAEVALIAANTPHIVFDAVASRSPIPLISIVEASAEETVRRGFGRVGLLGTRFTMEGSFYRDVFARNGIDLLAPEPEDLTFVHEAYMKELIPGTFRPETRAQVLVIVDRLREAGAEAVLLAGTELSPLLDGVENPALPLLDTGRIHVQRALAEMQR